MSQSCFVTGWVVILTAIVLSLLTSHSGNDFFAGIIQLVGWLLPLSLFKVLMSVMLVNSLSLQGPSVEIKGQGSWLSSWKNKHESTFKFFVNSDNYGHTLSAMGFTDGLSQGLSKAEVDWQWPAEPYGFSLGSISG